ncbi:MAG: GAF domain-containing protein [Actinobacteria bacterium]|nr:GAF domain-containing protein [Actinomycetota bacterium]
MVTPRRWAVAALTGGRPARRRSDRRRIGVLWTELGLRGVLAFVWVVALLLTSSPGDRTVGWLLTGVVCVLYLPITAMLAPRARAGAPLPHLLVITVDVALGAVGAALVPEWRVPVLFLYLALVVTTTIGGGGRRGLAVSVLTTLAASTLALTGGPRDTITLVALVPFAACAFALPVLISQLVAEHRRRAEHLARLHHALTSIAATSDLAGTFDAVSDTARAAVGASFVSLLTVDDTGTILTTSAVAAPDAEVPAVAVDTVELTTRLPAWSPSQLAARSGHPVIVRDPATETRFARWTPAALTDGVSAMVSVPLRSGGGIIGTLNAYWSEGGPDRDDVDLLAAYADGAALSILRAQAFEHERRAAAALRAAERSRAEFTASIAHELRTPLTTVRGFIETLLLREDQLSATDRRQMLEISRRNAVDLTHRIASLLEHAKLEGDHVTVDPKVQLLGPALANSLENCRGLLSDHPLVVDAPDGLLVDLDEIALDHVVANLVSNAVKYSPPGSPITVRAEVVGEDRVVVSVEDQGIGIPPADVPFVFDRFYRGGAQGRRSGTGIGLAIVKRYVELSGGRIGVESTPGEGTAFRFSLPYVGIEHADAGTDGSDVDVLTIRPDPAPVD